jgi:hypothetical protein
LQPTNERKNLEKIGTRINSVAMGGFLMDKFESGVVFLFL